MNEFQIAFTARGKVELLPQVCPEPQETEVVVRTERSLVSPGTELAVLNGTHAGFPDPHNTFAKYPHFPGYAAIGTVVSRGRAAREPQIGHRIFLHGRHAAWNLLRPAESVWVPVPPDISDDDVLVARLLQIAATTIHCLGRVPELAIVVGAGVIGLLAAQILKAQGTRQIVVQDIEDTRVAFAREAGVTAVLGNGEDMRLTAACAKLTGTPDCIVEATGVPAMTLAALTAVGKRGDVVLLGSPRGDLMVPLYSLIHAKGVRLLGAHETIIPARSADGPSRQAQHEQALEWIRQKTIGTRGIVSEVVSAAGAPILYASIPARKHALLTAAIDWR